MSGRADGRFFTVLSAHGTHLRDRHPVSQKKTDGFPAQPAPCQPAKPLDRNGNVLYAHAGSFPRRTVRLRVSVYSGDRNQNRADMVFRNQNKEETDHFVESVSLSVIYLLRYAPSAG